MGPDAPNRLIDVGYFRDHPDALPEKPEGMTAVDGFTLWDQTETIYEDYRDGAANTTGWRPVTNCYGEILEFRIYEVRAANGRLLLFDRRTSSADGQSTTETITSIGKPTLDSVIIWYDLVRSTEKMPPDQYWQLQEVIDLIR